MKEFTIKTTKTTELTLLALGFCIFLTGLFALRYNWAFIWLILGGVIIMGIAGENLKEINNGH